MQPKACQDNSPRNGPRGPSSPPNLHSMIRRLLLRFSSTSPNRKTQALSLNLYSTKCNKNNYKKNPNTNTSQSNLDHQLDVAISQLPPRFTTADLTRLLSAQPDPILCYHIFNWATNQPRFRPDSSLFLAAIKKLGAAGLHTYLHPIASLALGSLPPSQPLFNTILYFFCQSRSLSKAIFLYNRMRDDPCPSSAKPDLITYNLLFTALLGHGANSYIHHLYMDTVRSLFRQMVDSGVKPDARTLNFVVRGYVQSMHLNDALRVFHQFGNVYGVEPDESTYSWLVHGLCAQGRTRNAMEMYAEMKGKGLAVSRKAGNSLVSALALGGEVEEGVVVMWEVVGAGRGVEVVTLRTVVEGLARGGRGREEVAGFVRELREREVVNWRVARELMNWVEDGCGPLAVE